MASVPGLSMTAELNRLANDAPYAPTEITTNEWVQTFIYPYMYWVINGNRYDYQSVIAPADVNNGTVFIYHQFGDQYQQRFWSDVVGFGWVTFGPVTSYTCPSGGSYNSGSGMCEIGGGGGGNYPPMTEFKASQGAANDWAGTTGKGIIAALNYKADANRQPKDYKNLNAVCNELASTTGLSALAALRSL